MTWLRGKQGREKKTDLELDTDWEKQVSNSVFDGTEYRQSRIQNSLKILFFVFIPFHFILLLFVQQPMNKCEKTELETETQKHESQMRSIYSQLVF